MCHESIVVCVEWTQNPISHFLENLGSSYWDSASLHWDAGGLVEVVEWQWAANTRLTFSFVPLITLNRSYHVEVVQAAIDLPREAEALSLSLEVLLVNPSCSSEPRV